MMLSATLTGTADDLATVQVGGPRSGTNGKTFFNIEGNGNGSFSTFGVLEFGPNSAVFNKPFTIGDITDMTVKLTESNNPSYERPGTFNIYLVTDTTTSIQAGSSLHFDTSTVDGLNGQLGTATLLGTMTYTNTEPNYTDIVAHMNLPASAEQTLINDLNNHTTFRLVVGAASSTPLVAASLEGNYPPFPSEWPMISFTVEEATQQVTLGDMNNDGSVDFSDIIPFRSAITMDQATFEAANPGYNYLAGDANEDGSVDFSDIIPFRDLIANGGASASAVSAPVQQTSTPVFTATVPSAATSIFSADLISDKVDSLYA